MVDIAVVGSGVAGMVAASRLARAGHRVLVLEGREELGGRTRARPVHGDVLELGGQFIAARHRRMRQLVAEVGLHLRREQSDVGLVRWRRYDDPRSRLVPPFGGHDVLGLGQLLVALHRRPATDQLSAADWLGADRSNLGEVLRSGFSALFCSDINDVSAQQIAEFVDGLGGAVPALLSGLGMQHRIVEGTSELHARLAGQLTEPIRLGTAVTAVQQDHHGVSLTCRDGRSVEAAYAVVAVPVTAEITFDPPLPETQAYEAVGFGQATKVAAVVPRKRAWQAPGFVGGRLVRAGWRTRRVLYGIAVGETAECSDEALLTDLFAGFALSPSVADQTSVTRWSHDEFTHGTYICYRPGQLALRTRLARRFHRVLFASAERSPHWPIHMEGAAETGMSAAALIDRLAAT